MTVALESMFWTPTNVVTALFGCYMAGATWNCCRLSTCNNLQCHYIPSCIRRMHVCSAVTCHLHFWQNVQDFLHATTVTQEWNGHWNKSQHRKLMLEKKIFPLFLPGLEPKTFWHHESTTLPLSHPCSPHLRQNNIPEKYLQGSHPFLLHEPHSCSHWELIEQTVFTDAHSYTWEIIFDFQLFYFRHWLYQYYYHSSVFLVFKQFCCLKKKKKKI